MKDSTEGPSRDLPALARELAEAGYLVAKIPDCKRAGGHGRHGLITRTAICPGAEPMPHAFMNGHMGSFGYWASCACGHGFAAYTFGEDDGPTPWDEHVTEHGIDESPRKSRPTSSVPVLPGVQRSEQ